jgi:hypothetical protein
MLRNCNYSGRDGLAYFKQRGDDRRFSLRRVGALIKVVKATPWRRAPPAPNVMNAVKR